ncbi:23 kDa integral membrane protein-like isoform X2 [Mytilus californianus]|uniref:23 kDa integral membrane protein-like isoform X2 n=1 Tax=Mytilus californianus TaxID=6549 RepID=UPI0022454360|nr:23 kDa integral membrane protein-like isoform X2 [Mytilus californianus]
MTLGCGASIAKVILIIVNTIFLILGLGIGIAGLVFRFGTDLLGDEIKDAMKSLNVDVVGGINVYDIASSLSLLLIIVGFFIFLVGGLGCCGACCQNRVLLVVYAIIVAILLIAQIVGVAMFAGFRSSFDDTFKTEFKKVLTTRYNQTGNEDLTNSYDALFKLYKCCGVDSANDMPSQSLPSECCTATDPPSSCTNTSSTVHEGCYTKLKDQIDQYNSVFIGVGVSVLIFQLLCVLFSFCLCVAIGREE